MKKVFVFALIFMFGFTLYACGTDSDDEVDFKVGLIVSAAGANDMGYNQFAIEGLQAAEDIYNITTQVVTTADDIPGSLEALAEDGFDLIFSLEYNFDALITDDGTGQALAARYPDTTFVIFNDFANTDGEGNAIHDNVIEVIFSINEGSFLAGVAAVLVNEYHEILFTDERYDFTPLDAGGRTLGFVGGSQSAGMYHFSYGFYQGINYIAQLYDVQYQVYRTYDAGFAPTQENYNTIDSYYAAGANLVYAAAGGVNINLRSAAEDNGKLMIDVDADLDGEAPGYVLTSVLKNTNVPVSEMISAYAAGSLESGVSVIYDLESGAAGITDMSVIAQHVDDSQEAQDIWEYIMETLDDLYEKIESGEIDVVDAMLGESISFEDLTNLSQAN